MLLRKGNMRKLTFLAICIITFLTISVSSFAQESSLSAAQSSSAPAELKVDYLLPYPGLLPDNPFYFLRILRDRIVSFLISDTLKKAEFDLLQTDKRINAGITLAKEKKYELSNSTISKALNYFEEGVAKTKEAKKAGLPVGDIASRLYFSSLKQQEVLKELATKTSGNFAQTFLKELKRAEELGKRAKAI